MSNGAKGPVWDLPIRLFHWSLVLLIPFSWWSAKTGHLEWHLWSGSFILTLIVFRLLWGFFGSSTARFAKFVRGPARTLAYLRDTKGWTMAGHTPLGALSVIALIAAILVQISLGMVSVDEDGLFEGPLARFLTIDGNDQARDLHETWFWVIVALIALHVLAILYYWLRGKRLTKAMITGDASLEPGVAPMRPGKWWVALLCFAAGIAFTRWLLAGAPPFGG